MTWEAGDRPGDVLRALADLDLDIADPAVVAALGTTLGFDRRPDQWIDAGVVPAPKRDVTPPTAALQPTALTRRSWFRSWLVVFLIGGVAGAALAAGVAALSPLLLIPVTVVGAIPWLARRLRERRRRRAITSSVVFGAAPTTASEMPLLLRSEERRSIAQALASVVRSGSEIDADEAVARAATAQSVPNPLPVVPELATAPITHLLVDQADAMSPLRADVDDLIDAIRRSVGDERMDVAYFHTDPRRGAGPGPSFEWQPFEPTLVESGSRIVVLSDLGAGSADHSAQLVGRRRWRGLVDDLRGAGADVVLVSVFGGRRGAGLGDVPLVDWSERTTTRDVLAVVRDRA